jgi:hypothetical protein
MIFCFYQDVVWPPMRNESDTVEARFQRQTKHNGKTIPATRQRALEKHTNPYPLAIIYHTGHIVLFSTITA